MRVNTALRIIIYKCLILQFLSFAAFAQAGEGASGPFRGKDPRVVYWIDSDFSGPFDEGTLRFLSENSGAVVLNVPEKGPFPEYDYASIVKRLHELNPRLTVLLYAWPSRWYSTPRISSTAFSDYPSLGDLLVHERDGSVVSFKKDQDLQFGDVTNDLYRDWIVRRIKKTIEDTGADGAALDMAFRSAPAELDRVCRESPSFCAAYPSGMDKLMEGIFRIRPHRVVAFNGLWNYRGLLEDQKRLMNYADITAIEWFGRSPWEPFGFTDGVLQYLEVIRSNPQMVFMVFGAGPLKYTGYAADYLWQRYLYSSYMLAAGPNTFFKYNTLFSLSHNTVRTLAMDAYSDWYLQFGEPLGPYKALNGVYYRSFAKGLVAVAPHDGAGGRFDLPEEMFTPEGEALKGTVNLKPGEALLLLAERPNGIKTFSEDFEESTPPESSWESAKTSSEEGGNHFLHVDRVPVELEWVHDLALDRIRSLQNGGGVTVRVRTGDPGAVLKFVAEVDDSESDFSDLVVLAGPGAGNIAGDAKGRGFAFRYGTYKRNVPYLKAGVEIPPDNLWHTIRISGKETVDKAGRYTFHRWSFMRLIGTIDIDDISIR